MFLLILSLLLIFPLVLQDNIFIVFFQFITMIIIAFIRKKRVKLLPSFFVISSLVIFSFLSPFGKVWFTLGSFKITEGAFFLGLKKGFVLCGMVFISQLATSFEIKIKGNFGKLISNVFYWFNIFSSVDKENRKKMGLNLKSIDEYLCQIYFEEENSQENQDSIGFSRLSKANPKVWITFLLIINLIFYFLLIFNNYSS